MMQIPTALKTERFYVATSEEAAFSSWNTEAEAKTCIDHFRRYCPTDWKNIKGVLKVNEHGRSWCKL